ncbi:MAG: hypothetical protein WBL63_17930 [Candidatus Acidiferrum sp.]
MFHLMPGISGLIVGAAIFIGIGTGVYFTREHESYNLDPQGKPGAFEPFLARYIRASEFIIGLATGSIVLLVGSSALHAQGGRLPWFYASPLLLLALCVVFGIAFMVWLVYHYEEHQHGTPHTRIAYTLSLTLGFTALTCFCVGYVWLILCVTG